MNYIDFFPDIKNDLSNVQDINLMSDLNKLKKTGYNEYIINKGTYLYRFTFDIEESKHPNYINQDYIQQMKPYNSRDYKKFFSFFSSVSMLWPLRSPKILPQNKTGYVLQYIVTQDITVNIADKNLSLILSCIIFKIK
jgi:hypothetical protein